MSKREFEVIEQGTTYALPIWEVLTDKGIEETGEQLTVQFVRGSKLKDQDVERKDGILHETLIAMIISDLKYKYKLFPSIETKNAIVRLQESLFWLEERQRERELRGVNGTYKK